LQAYGARQFGTGFDFEERAAVGVVRDHACAWGLSGHDQARRDAGCAPCKATALVCSRATHRPHMCRIRSELPLHPGPQTSTHPMKFGDVYALRSNIAYREPDKFISNFTDRVSDATVPLESRSLCNCRRGSGPGCGARCRALPVARGAAAAEAAAAARVSPARR
jgi:hypothetical protein